MPEGTSPVRPLAIWLRGQAPAPDAALVTASRPNKSLPDGEAMEVTLLQLDVDIVFGEGVRVVIQLSQRRIYSHLEADPPTNLSSTLQIH